MTLFQRDMGEDLFALSGEEYLQHFNVKCYLNDVVRQLLDCRDDRPTDFFSEYFLAVLKGTHVLHRGYEYITATHHNRAAFGLMFSLAFPEAEFSEPLGLDEFSQLVYLICPGFPQAVIKRVHDIAGVIDTRIGTLATAIAAHVYYPEFFDELERLQVPEAGASRKSVLIDALCILARNSKRDAHAAKQDRESASEPLYGQQPPHYPTKDVLQAAVKATSTSGGDDTPCTLEQVQLAIYMSPLVKHTIATRHPALFATMTTPGQPGRRPNSVNTVVDTILHTHEYMILSGKRRKQKAASVASTR